MIGIGIGTSAIELAYSDAVLSRFGRELPAIQREVLEKVLEHPGLSIEAHEGRIAVDSEGNSTFYLRLPDEEKRRHSRS